MKCTQRVKLLRIMDYRAKIKTKSSRKCQNIYFSLIVVSLFHFKMSLEMVPIKKSIDQFLDLPFNF